MTKLTKMEVNISGAASAQLKMASKKLGFKEQEIANRAVLFYVDTLAKEMDLKEELSEWDSLSDEALAKVEKSL